MTETTCPSRRRRLLPPPCTRACLSDGRRLLAANSCNSIRSHPWELTSMRRRDVLKSALAGATALAAPRVVQAEGAKTITFTPHADLASLDPVWTTADITRNFSLAVYDTLYGYDAQFQVQPQMVAGHTVDADAKTWELTLRDGLAFHDGQKVLARDCVATIKRFGTR